MRAIVLERYGPPGVLQLEEVAKPEPGDADVVVRVHAASINDWDWEMLRGGMLVIRLLHGLFTPRVRVLGCDVAGRVEAVGDAVTALKPGDDVYADLCMSGFGAFAEYARAPATSFARMPAGMTFEQAAAIPQAGMLAVQGLVDAGRIQRGQRVLLNGAGGGVGTIALQIAKLHDAEVTVVDKGIKLDMLRGLGADHVVDFEKTDFTASGKRYDLILDTKTNRPLRAYLRALNPGGTYATVGGDINRLLQIALLGPAISRLSGKRLRMVGLQPNKDLAFVNRLFEAGQLSPVIDRIFAFGEIPDALTFFGTGNHKGKIVIRIT